MAGMFIELGFCGNFYLDYGKSRINGLFSKHLYLLRYIMWIFLESFLDFRFKLGAKNCQFATISVRVDVRWVHT